MFLAAGRARKYRYAALHRTALGRIASHSSIAPIVSHGTTRYAALHRTASNRAALHRNLLHCVASYCRVPKGMCSGSSRRVRSREVRAHGGGGGGGVSSCVLRAAVCAGIVVTLELKRH